LDIPRIETNTANQQNVTGWQVPAANPLARCSSFSAPPVVTGIEGADASNPSTWWYGYSLIVPGAGSQNLLQRNTSTPAPTISGVSFPIGTKQNWMVGCGVTTDNDGGEGFLVVAPDGTQYTLNHLVYRAMPTATRPMGTGPNALTTRAIASPNLNPNDSVNRRFALMLATKVVDRFGDTLTYTYSGDNLTDIKASDGREITLSYVSGTTQVQSVTLLTSTGSPRTWTYAYANAVNGVAGPTLVSVTLPDGSAWSYNLGKFLTASAIAQGGTCTTLARMGTDAVVGTITQPSGLLGTFTLTATAHGRSYVPKSCISTPSEPDASAEIPFASYSFSLTSKTFSGAGITTPRIWTYSYSPPAPSFDSDPCAATKTCASTVYTDELDPEGHDTRYTFSNEYDASEGSLLETDHYTGAAGSTVLRSEINGYASPTAGPWPAPYGYELQQRVNFHVSENVAPENQRLVVEEGDTYTWEAQAFDAFAHPTQVARYSNIAGQPSITEKTTYLNDTALWVLGLPQEVDNLSHTGGPEVETLNTFNALDELTARSKFGQQLMTYGYDSAGQLASFTDPKSHTTTLSNYKRAIPQTIGFPDGTSESLVVDDFGEITSLTDQAAHTTSYSYDPVGRIAGINYPSGDAVAWAPTSFTYNFVTSAERGIGANHWRRTVTHGGKADVTYFDSMLEPLITDTYRISDGGLHVSVGQTFDSKGNTTFSSYPVSGSPDATGFTLGVTTAYDALSRVTLAQQTSELGTLTTATAYLQGARKQTTDPKGNVTTTTYQVFDSPSYSNAVLVQAPEGVAQSIVRDLYGNPQTLTQGSVVRSIVYDPYYRVCRTTDPESKSQITSYDAANNVAWTASGIDVTPADIQSGACGQELVTTAVETTRSYDAMNRVTGITYPAGTAATTMSYTATGKPLTETSGTVSWLFGYNGRDLITGQTLSVDGFNWAIGYGYDANANLASTVYPDGKAVTYAPDALGRPTQAGTYASLASYAPDGTLAQFAFGSNAIYVASENPRNLMSEFSYSLGSTKQVDESFAYDANANITGITDQSANNGQRTKAFGYDGLNRLTSAIASGLWGNESYTYDVLNNITSVTSAGATHTYNYDGSNHLASISGSSGTENTFVYDARGNTSTKNNVPLVFDDANRLTQITGYDGYVYDAEGRRVKKTPTSGTATYYAYSQAGQLLWQYDAATTNATDYIYLGNKMVASAVNTTSTTMGNIDGVSSGANAVITGWACSTGLPSSISVDLYLNGPTGTGTGIARYTANVASEPGIATACHSTGTAYRFSIPVAESTRISYANQTIYIYGISPVGNANNLLAQSGSFKIPPSINAPVAPTVLNASASGDLSSISLAWTAAANSTSYVLQEQSNGGAWTQIYAGTATTFGISNPADATYGFRVEACNANGCSAQTSSSAVTIAHIPPAPAAISVPSTSTGSIAIGWSASSYATSYSLQQSVNGGGFATIYSGANTSYGYSVGTTATYSYRVQACNSHGCSGFGPTGSSAITIPPSGTTSIAGGGGNTTGTYTLSWGGIAGATTYHLVQQINGGGWTEIKNDASTSWATSGHGNGTYGYEVQGCNAGGCGPWSAVVNVTVTLIPPVPTGLSLVQTSPLYKGRYTLSWNAASSATTYEVQMKTPTAGWTTVSSGSATNAAGILTSTTGTVQFEVHACDAAGCSAWSAPVSGQWQST
jgi:YD repeat-containing protein